MCVKRDVCISLSLLAFRRADISHQNSISTKRPKNCTQSHSCHCHWVRHLRNLLSPLSQSHRASRSLTLRTILFMIHELFHGPLRTLTSNSTIFDDSCTLRYL